MANVEPIDTTQQPISDDQELAKVLAGIDDRADDAGTDSASVDESVLPDPVADDVAVPSITPVAAPVVPSLGGDLDAVKQQALTELRPLVDKLEVGPEEKFDTYLLLLRSTDDRDLIAPAHEAAKLIPDESRRAQALLDIIKEIDFLSQNAQG